MFQSGPAKRVSITSASAAIRHHQRAAGLWIVKNVFSSTSCAVSVWRMKTISTRCTCVRETGTATRRSAWQIFLRSSIEPETSIRHSITARVAGPRRVGGRGSADRSLPGMAAAQARAQLLNLSSSSVRRSSSPEQVPRSPRQLFDLAGDTAGSAMRRAIDMRIVSAGEDWPARIPGISSAARVDVGHIADPVRSRFGSSRSSKNSCSNSSRESTKAKLSRLSPGPARCLTLTVSAAGSIDRVARRYS